MTTTTQAVNKAKAAMASYVLGTPLEETLSVIFAVLHGWGAEEDTLKDVLNQVRENKGSTFNLSIAETRLLSQLQSSTSVDMDGRRVVFDMGAIVAYQSNKVGKEKVELATRGIITTLKKGDWTNGPCVMDLNTGEFLRESDKKVVINFGIGLTPNVTDDFELPSGMVNTNLDVKVLKDGTSVSATYITALVCSNDTNVNLRAKNSKPTKTSDGVTKALDAYVPRLATAYDNFFETHLLPHKERCRDYLGEVGVLPAKKPKLGDVILIRKAFGQLAGKTILGKQLQLVGAQESEFERLVQHVFSQILTKEEADDDQFGFKMQAILEACRGKRSAMEDATKPLPKDLSILGKQARAIFFTNLIFSYDRDSKRFSMTHVSVEKKAAESEKKPAKPTLDSDDEDDGPALENTSFKNVWKGMNPVTYVGIGKDDNMVNFDGFPNDSVLVDLDKPEQPPVRFVAMDALKMEDYFSTRIIVGDGYLGDSDSLAYWEDKVDDQKIKIVKKKKTVETVDTLNDRMCRTLPFLLAAIKNGGGRPVAQKVILNAASKAFPFLVGVLTKHLAIIDFQNNRSHNMEVEIIVHPGVEVATSEKRVRRLLLSIIKRGAGANLMRQVSLAYGKMVPMTTDLTGGPWTNVNGKWESVSNFTDCECPETVPLRMTSGSMILTDASIKNVNLDLADADDADRPPPPEVKRAEVKVRPGDTDSGGSGGDDMGGGDRPHVEDLPEPDIAGGDESSDDDYK